MISTESNDYATPSNRVLNAQRKSRDSKKYLGAGYLTPSQSSERQMAELTRNSLAMSSQNGSPTPLTMSDSLNPLLMRHLKASQQSQQDYLYVYDSSVQSERRYPSQPRHKITSPINFSSD